MSERYTVKLKTIVEVLNLTIVHKSNDYDEAVVYTPDLNRPGLQLAGFYDYFDPERIQVIGRVETTYLSKFTSEERRGSFERLMSKGIAALSYPAASSLFPSASKRRRSMTSTCSARRATHRSSWPSSSGG